MLKQNRGSAGEGIWVVRPRGWDRAPGYVPGDGALVACTEMKDNTTHVFLLGDFMQMCLQYIEGTVRGLSVWERGLPARR